MMAPSSQAVVRFDRKFGWNEMREAHAGPNPFAARGEVLEAVRFDDEDFRPGRVPTTHRWTGDLDEDEPGFGMALAAIAVVLIVVLLISVTLVI